MFNQLLLNPFFCKLHNMIKRRFNLILIKCNTKCDICLLRLTSCVCWLLMVYKCFTIAWHSCRVGTIGGFGGRWTRRGSTVALKGRPVDDDVIVVLLSLICEQCVFNWSCGTDIDLLKINRNHYTHYYYYLLWNSDIMNTRTHARTHAHTHTHTQKQQRKRIRTTNKIYYESQIQDTHI